MLRRRWEFYFAYCEAAFDCGYIKDHQIVWQATHDALPNPSTLHKLAAAASFNTAASPQALSSNSRQGSAASAEKLPGLEPLGSGRLSGGALTWALFSVYCLLGGAVIARQPYMLAAVLTFALGQGLTRVRHSVLLR
jgi:hypothetical protein